MLPLITFFFLFNPKLLFVIVYSCLTDYFLLLQRKLEPKGGGKYIAVFECDIAIVKE